jgi:hypothetical protein
MKDIIPLKDINVMNKKCCYFKGQRRIAWLHTELANA